MLVLDKKDSFTEAAGKALLTAHGIRIVEDVDSLLSILPEKNPEEPVIVFDCGEKADVLLNISFVKKIRGDVKLYVISQRKEDAAFAVEAFRAGADDLFFYSSHQDIDGFLMALRHGVPNKYLSKTAAFAGSGTGSTFLAVNVAHCLRRLYKDLDVCLVDCDSFRNDVALRMGATETQQLLTVTDLVSEIYEAGVLDIRSSLLANKLSGVTVVPAAGLSFNMTQCGEEEYIKTLHYISAQHDITLFNLGSSFDTVFRSVLSLSDRLLLTVTQDIVPLRVAMNLIGYTRSAGRDIAEVIVNRYSREKESRLSLDQIGSILGKDVLLTLPEDYRAVSASEFGRRPVQISDNSSLFSAIESLSQQILKSFLKG